MVVALKRLLFIAICILFKIDKSFQAQQTICTTLEQNTDYKGNDLKIIRDAKSYLDCARVCSVLYNICTGFTFWKMGSINLCFLKNFTSPPLKIFSVGRISCTMLKVPYLPSSSSSCVFLSSTSKTTSMNRITSTSMQNVSTSRKTTTTATITGLSNITITKTSKISSSTSVSKTTPSTTTTTTSRNSNVSITTSNPKTTYTNTISFSTPPTATTSQFITFLTTTATVEQTTSETSASDQCYFQFNAFYGDASVAFVAANAKDLGECCALCWHNQGNCVLFSFLVDISMCYIYSYPWQNSKYRPWTMSGGLLQKNPDSVLTPPPEQTTKLYKIASPECTYQSNMFYGELELAFDFLSAKTQIDCCNICYNDLTNCASFSFLYDKSICIIYSNEMLLPHFSRFNTTSGKPNLNNKLKSNQQRIKRVK